MIIEMVMPQMGESITEATVSRWKKRVGDRVERDEVILEISTDKVDSEIPAPESGVLAEILVAEGETVPVKSVIARIDASAAGKEGKATAAQVTAQESASKDSSSRRAVSPLVRELAAKHGVSLEELESLSGSGEGGRITKSDLLEFIARRDGQTTERSSTDGDHSVQAQPASPPLSAPPAKATGSTSTGGDKSDITLSQSSPKRAAKETVGSDLAAVGEWRADGTKVVPMDAMRQAIAAHMVRSKQTSPHVYTIQEIDVTAVSKWRAKYKEEFKKREGFNLTFTPFFLEAAVQALLTFPLVNSSVQEKTIIFKKHINLGCAVALGTSGLIVPVIHHAEERNLVGLARALNDLSERARAKKLLPGDVQGGTFTVTNIGGFGSLIGTPIINQPQVAILCVGLIEKRPVVIDDMLAIRERCYATLSYDHRVIDGALGGRFLAHVRAHIEGWDGERTLYT